VSVLSASSRILAPPREAEDGPRGTDGDRGSNLKFSISGRVYRGSCERVVSVGLYHRSWDGGQTREKHEARRGEARRGRRTEDERGREGERKVGSPVVKEHDLT
jgi:hypothetical protein